MLARNRQEMIANELSRLAGDEYLEDIMQHMRHMEVGPLGPHCHLHRLRLPRGQGYNSMPVPSREVVSTLLNRHSILRTLVGRHRLGSI